LGFAKKRIERLSITNIFGQYSLRIFYCKNAKPAADNINDPSVTG
jgi:hypothetical protein